MALVLSASITLLSTWDTFYNHRGLWVRYTGTVTELKAIRSKLEYLLSDGERNVDSAELDALYDRLQVTLTETNMWWQQERKAVTAERDGQ